MLFTAPEFLAFFLPATLFLVGSVIRLGGKAAGMKALILASVIFYGQWNPVDLGVISASIAINYAIARGLSTIQRKRFRLGLLWGGIVLNVGALAYYKYTNFFLQIFGETPVTIIMPLAISFYTFQQIAFIVDVYRRQIGQMPLTNYIVSVLFFPHLIAGPLIHYDSIMEQFSRRFSVTLANIATGTPIFALGLVKKVTVADTLGNIVNPIYTTAATQPLEFFTAWVAALGYTAQLYFDFSGYSDMAIGLGLMFGIMLPLNFNSPYKSRSIIEFWRRWHMTLSAFLRDYLYIPLGGNKVSRPRWYLNLMLVMLIGGLWHGAGWTFVFWGGLHGLYLVINHLWRNNIGTMKFANAVLQPIFPVVTFVAVVVAWVFFRSPTFDSALNVLQGMAGMTFISLPGELGQFLPLREGTLLGIKCDGRGLTYAMLVLTTIWLLLAYAIIFFGTNADEIFGLSKPSWLSHSSRSPLRAFGAASLTGLAFWASAFGIVGSTPSQFLYFQF